MFDILDYLQVEIKKKCQCTKRKYDEKIKQNEFIENIESAIGGVATMEILLENAKKTFFEL